MLQLRHGLQGQGFDPIFIPLLLMIKLISITTLFKNLMVLNYTILVKALCEYLFIVRMAVLEDSGRFIRRLYLFYL